MSSFRDEVGYILDRVYDKNITIYEGVERFTALHEREVTKIIGADETIDLYNTSPETQIWQARRNELRAEQRRCANGEGKQ